MKTTTGEKGFCLSLDQPLTRVLVVAGFLFVLPMVQASSIGPGDTNTAPVYTVLDSWSFGDSVTWKSDKNYAPVSFTNLDFSYLGNGASLVVDSTNPAWLQFNVYEGDGKTNLTVNAGTVMFWFAPSWSGTNQGGTGPGEFGRLLEAGGYTPDSSYGLWSIYVDDAGNNLYFSTQTNDLSSNVWTYLSYPVAWTTNYFHFVALTYSPTNTALYLDGELATNGPPLTVYPGPAALANGFFIGSDSNGVLQAHGLFNSVATYNVPMDPDTIRNTYSQQAGVYLINPLNTAMIRLVSADSNPSFTNGYSAISGTGNLLWVSNAVVCISDTNVWFTNVTATAAGDGTMNVTFTIAGGLDYSYYDIFATGALQSPLTNSVWVWLGQGAHCVTYTINIPSANAFLILGTPQDTDGDGLTDAYEFLVSHTNPNLAESDSNGIPYAWYIQNGLSPQSGQLDPDQDALKNYQEYQYGTRPQVSEGFAIWTGLTSSIP